MSNFLFFVTVLKVPLSVDVNNQTFIASMEQKLATAFVMAFERQKQIAEGTYEPLRRRRAAQVQDTVVNVSIFVIICKIDWSQSTYSCGLLWLIAIHVYDEFFSEEASGAYFQPIVYIYSFF